VDGRSFKHKGLRALFINGRTRHLGTRFKPKCLRIVDMLDAAESLKDLNVPGFDFHSLKGLNPTRYAMKVTGNYRVTFSWVDGESIEIDFEDYH